MDNKFKANVLLKVWGVIIRVQPSCLLTVFKAVLKLTLGWENIVDRGLFSGEVLHLYRLSFLATEKGM